MPVPPRRRILGIIEDLIFVRDFDDLAGVHEDDVVRGVAGETHLVGDDDLGHALSVQIAHHLEDLVYQSGVER
jgi:hypothetical protein